MDSKQLEELLQKYWDCETSLEEEKQLHEYFRTNQVPEHWKETAALFHYFNNQKGRSVNEQFEGNVLRNLKASPAGKSRKLFQTTLRIAAGVAVLMAAVFFVRKEIRDKSDIAMEDTYDDPQKALEETKKAFMMISQGFGKAEQQAKKINVLNEAQEKIEGDRADKKQL
jgi:hypothetical protein